MIEVIDNDNNKRIAKVLCFIKDNDDVFVLYYINRDENNVNVFVSRIVCNSEGASVIDSELLDSDKLRYEDICRRIFSKDNIGDISFVKDIDLTKGINRFEVDKSYICTIGKDVIDECSLYYQFGNNNKVIVSVVEGDKQKTRIKLRDIFAIVFGIVVICFCIVMVIFSFIK